MSENQPETTNTDVSPQPTPELATELRTKILAFFTSWKVIFGLIGVAIITVGVIVFFWPHWVAVAGMNNWAQRAQAQPIECVLQDTNDDRYISCSAMLDGQVVPLECSSSIFNLGCRVRYGSSAPPLRRNSPTL